MKKWTKAERERASREGKARWAARKLRSSATSPAAEVKDSGAENDRNVIRAALLLHANGDLSDKQVVDIVDRAFHS